MAKRFSKLTRPAMRTLPPNQSISEHGITFRRDASGDGVFSVNVMVDRRRIHRVIGRESDGVTRQQAEDFIAIARTDARRDRLELPDGRKTPLAFREEAEKYVEKLKEESGKNIRAKDRQLRQHLVPFFGSSPLGQIASFDIERYKRARRRLCPERVPWWLCKTRPKGNLHGQPRRLRRLRQRSPPCAQRSGRFSVRSPVQLPEKRLKHFA